MVPSGGEGRGGPARRCSIERVSRTLAVVLAGGEGERLSILSGVRAKPAVPFGGKYRIIDFTLSNCVNSDIDDVIVLTQYDAALAERPHRRRATLGPRPEHGRHPHPAAVHRARPAAEWYRGTADAVLPEPRRHPSSRAPTSSSSWPATTSTRWTTDRSSSSIAGAGPT